MALNNQGRGRGYQPKPKAKADNPYRDLDYSMPQKPNLIIVLLYIEREKKRKSRFYFFTDGKQHQADELDMITRRNHAPRSYMT